MENPFFSRLENVPPEYQHLVDRIKRGVEVVRGATGDLRITADALDAGVQLLVHFADARQAIAIGHAVDAAIGRLELQLAGEWGAAQIKAMAERPEFKALCAEFVAGIKEALAPLTAVANAAPASAPQG